MDHQTIDSPGHLVTYSYVLHTIFSEPKEPINSKLSYGRERLGRFGADGRASASAWSPSVAFLGLLHDDHGASKAAVGRVSPL
ncbi:hypothetical protein GQ600_15601 [Phytophthora cactorum]|nr:hypothetical protein GQ600_15601 [Phytophthora cactorum]